MAHVSWFAPHQALDEKSNSANGPHFHLLHMSVVCLPALIPHLYMRLVISLNKNSISISLTFLWMLKYHYPKHNIMPLFFYFNQEFK